MIALVRHDGTALIRIIYKSSVSYLSKTPDTPYRIIISRDGPLPFFIDTGYISYIFAKNLSGFVTIYIIL